MVYLIQIKNIFEITARTCTDRNSRGKPTKVDEAMQNLFALFFVLFM